MDITGFLAQLIVSHQNNTICRALSYMLRNQQRKSKICINLQPDLYHTTGASGKQDNVLSMTKLKNTLQSVYNMATSISTLTLAKDS